MFLTPKVARTLIVVIGALIAIWMLRGYAAPADLIQLAMTAFR